MLVSLFNKFAGLRPVILLKRDVNKGFSCEYCEIFKNGFLYKTPLVAAFEPSSANVWNAETVLLFARFLNYWTKTCF